MDSHSLRLFLSLADNLHFGRTSREQHVSPSALSRSIKQLEDELGATLFVRDNRSVRLTREGQQFREYASEVINGWQAIRQTFMQDQLNLHGELSLYCSVTASYSFLYDILSSFRQDYPRIEMKLHTGDPAKAASVAGKLRAGMVAINNWGPTPGAPFGGYKQSGNGREGGLAGLKDFMETKAISGLPA